MNIWNIKTILGNHWTGCSTFENRDRPVLGIAERVLRPFGQQATAATIEHEGNVSGSQFSIFAVERTEDER